MIQLLLGAFIFISAPIFMKSRMKGLEYPLPIIYILEVMGLISLWTIVSLPFIYMDQKFSMAVHVYLLILLGVYLGIFIYAFTRKYRRERKSDRIKDALAFLKSNKFTCIITFLLIGYQLLRCFILQTDGYRDSKTYIALINDMVETNRFFLLDDVYGYFGMNLEEVSPKYIFSGWYTFEAFLSYGSGIHPLIIVNTILPPVILLFSYLSYWILSELLFGKNTRKRMYFVLFIALIFQFLSDDTGVLFMIWPTWGKNLVLSVSIPVYLYFYFMKQSDERLRHIALCFVTFFACFVSTTGVVVMAVMIIGCKLYSVMSNRKVRVVDVWSVMIQMIPIVLYALIYKLW